MKSILETLSKANIEKLSDYLDDSNFDKYFPKIRSLLSSESDDIEKNKFWNRGSLNNIAYNRHVKVNHKIIKIFYRAGLIKELEYIINNDGIISSDELYNKNQKGNLIDIIVKKLNTDKKDEIKDIIKDISIMKPSRAGVSLGNCEILLRFILKDSIEISKGDVSLKDNKSLEVKCFRNENNKESSGFSPKGQFDMKSLKDSIKEMCKKLPIKEENRKSVYEKDTEYTLGSKNNRLYELFNKEGILTVEGDNIKIINKEKFIDALILIQSELYNIDTYDNITLYDSIEKLLKNETYKISEIKKMVNNIFMCLQLYFYVLKEKNDYIILIYFNNDRLDSSDKITESKSNFNYIMFKEEDLLDFENVLKYINIKSAPGNGDRHKTFEINANKNML